MARELSFVFLIFLRVKERENMQETWLEGLQSLEYFYLALYRESLPASSLTESRIPITRHIGGQSAPTVKMREPKGTKTLEYNSFNAPGIQTFIELPCLKVISS